MADVIVLGAGINGLMSARALLERGHRVTMYDAAECMSQTSQSSTKLLHGGLRYLEHGQFSLVHSALHARRWWLTHAPSSLVRPLSLIYPIYAHNRRSRLTLCLGLTLYDLLAFPDPLAEHQWLSASQVLERLPTLAPRGLKGGYLFADVQMHDLELGQWVKADLEARYPQFTLHENTPALTIGPNGTITLVDGEVQADVIVNATGPWASELMRLSQIDSPYGLELVRGSHLMLKGSLSTAVMLEVPQTNRIMFAIPYKGSTLVGTTECLAQLSERDPTAQEETDIMETYNTYFTLPAQSDDIIARFAGLRPLVTQIGRHVKSTSSRNRESVVWSQDRVVTVYGGKWTTSRLLGIEVAGRVGDILRLHPFSL